MKTTILLADDHKIIRDGLRALIEKMANMEVVSEVEDGRSAVKNAMKFKPDVIIMDINMPELNGVDATRQIISELPTTKIIALSMYSERRYVTGMLKAGVSGYLLKNSAFDELADAIFTVLKNQTYLSPKVSLVVMNDYTNNLSPEDASVADVLTSREREVLQLISEGFDSNQIAARLHVSVKTVSTHRRKIMDKLDINNLAGLVKYAIREGLTTLDG